MVLYPSVFFLPSAIYAQLSHAHEKFLKEYRPKVSLRGLAAGTIQQFNVAFWSESICAASAGDLRLHSEFFFLLFSIISAFSVFAHRFPRTLYIAFIYNVHYVYNRCI